MTGILINTRKENNRKAQFLEIFRREHNKLKEANAIR
jgi:hypothetical protein